MTATAKEIFDKKYAFYRNLENKPAIPLEARQIIFNSMTDFARQKCKEQRAICQKIYLESLSCRHSFDRDLTIAPEPEM